LQHDIAGDAAAHAPLRVYLSGSRSFGAAVLEMIERRGSALVGVACPVEDERGRPDRLYQAVQERAPEVPHTPTGDFRAASIPEGTDLILAAHSHVFLGPKTMARTRLGCLGYHPSLLPMHRGRDAIRWAVHMRERVTGGTVYWYTEHVDAGPIAAQDWCFIRPEWTASDLWSQALFPMGIRLFERALEDVEAGRVVRREQDESLATWEPSWERPPLAASGGHAD
jgi:methionyl-tRNA formyltransferase